MEEFIPPPEAPVFQPTAEEFKDPIAYISKIHPVVVNTGICKIRPPPGWKPPFAVNVETFKFTPRVQPLNELEAKTRVKLNFLENLAKFWELQGIVFKIPNVDRHPLDLHGLFKVVTGMGGYQEVCRLRKWASVAKELSYYYVTVAGSLKVNYEKYLYPYEIFLVNSDKLQEVAQTSNSSPTKLSGVTNCKYGLRQKRRTRSCAEDPTDTVELDKTNPEFKKLAFTAPGPKNSFAPLQREDYRKTVKRKDGEGLVGVEDSHTQQTIKAEPLTQASEERFVSARTHPSIIPSERYVSARTHPQPIKRFAMDRPQTEASDFGMETGGSGMKIDGSRMGVSHFGIETKTQTSHFVSESLPANYTIPQTTIDPSTAQQEVSPIELPLESSKVKSESSVTKDEGPKLTSSGEHVFQCSTESSDPMDAVKCVTCGSGDYDDELLLCDGCDESHHMFCLEPPLQSLPPGEWRCPNCVAEECNKPQDSFGFEQAEKQYTLRTFGQMANTFKQEYFNRSPHEVPYSAVEKEFWRLVSSIEDEVVVEYGADLHTSKVGSGFPWESTVNSNEDEKYANSLWNLNRMPNANGCVLKYIDADISGMKVPWAYVGMCFSCFCWHIEDHWSYSINYLHWGEPKTWYGVPSAYAESLEATMKQQAPELFENHPDLMHDLVTTLSPNVLMKNGIPVVRTDQCAGEFVVTFPRAYHAGFNQGFNFAEAVNFSLSDWITMGRASIKHYQSFNRSPVFSHDELVCKMMAQCANLDLCLLVPTCKDAAVMVRNEEEFRNYLKKKGYIREQRELFEIVRDEERQCTVCKTYCFLSAVKCTCGHRKLACPLHVDDLCECPSSKKVFKYRYTLNELRGMLSSLQSQTEAYTTWVKKVDVILDSTDTTKTDVQVLRDLLDEASERGFSGSEACEELLITLQDVKKCVNTALQIGNGKHRTRHSTGKALDVGGLKEFLEQVEGLPCRVPEAEVLRTKLTEVQDFQREVSSILSQLDVDGDTTAVRESAHLEELIKKGEGFEVYIPEVKALKMALQQMTWISETESRLDGNKLTIDTLKTIQKLGTSLSRGSQAVECTLNRVKSLLAIAQDWETKTKNTLKQKPPPTVDCLSSLLEEGEAIPVVLQSEHTIREALEKAKNWSLEAKILQDSDSHPQYTSLKTLLESGRSIPVKLELIPQLESCYTAAKAWFDRATRAVMKKNCSQSLLEVLLPRNKANFFLRHISKGPRKRVETDFSHYEDPLADVLGDHDKEVAKIHEMEAMEKTFATQLRTENTQKSELDEAIKSGSATGAAILYCFCQKPESGYMLQCELCQEWYHASCLRLPKGKQGPEKDIGKWTRFLCSFCQRTRRPRLDSIVSLLISLQKVPVSITEGSALQCLAERSIAWQRKARQSITSVTLTLESARTQQKRIEEIKGHIARWKNEAKADQTGPTSTIQAQLASSAGSVLNHYESEMERIASKYAGLGPTRRSNLDNLLMEGDLLEVTMDEVQQLWQLLQQDAQLLISFQQRGNTEAEPSPVDDQDKRRRRKRKEPSPALSTASTNSVSSDSLKGPPTKKSRRKTRPLTKASPSPSPSKTSTSLSVPQSSDSSRFANRKTREQSTGSASSNEGLGCSEEVPGEDDEEEESECSAAKCLQPVAEEISWVQCDVCQGWFHCMCVGLTKEYAEKIESYNCVNCRNVKPGTPQKSSGAKVPNSPALKGPKPPGSSPVILRRGIVELTRALQNTISNASKT